MIKGVRRSRIVAHGAIEPAQSALVLALVDQPFAQIGERPGVAQLLTLDKLDRRLKFFLGALALVLAFVDERRVVMGFVMLRLSFERGLKFAERLVVAFVLEEITAQVIVRV